MKTSRQKLFVAFVAMLLVLVAYSCLQRVPQKQGVGDVLVIWPLDEKDQIYTRWNDRLVDTLRANGIFHNIHFLYLSWDMGHKEKRRYEMLRDTLRHMTERGERPQLIITYGDMPTYAVASAPYEEFRTIPVLFFGTHFPNYRGVMENYHNNMTGLVDSIHLKENIDFITDVTNKKIVVTQLEWSLNWCDSLLRDEFDHQMEQLDTAQYFNLIPLDARVEKLKDNYGKKMFYALSVNSPDCNWVDSGHGFTADFNFSRRSRHTVPLQVKYDYYCYSKHMDEPCAPFFTTTPQHFVTNDSCVGGYFPNFRSQVSDLVRGYVVPILKEGKKVSELPIGKHNPSYHLNWNVFRGTRVQLSDIPSYVNVENVRFSDRHPFLFGVLLRSIVFSFLCAFVILHYVFFRENMSLKKQKELKRKHNLDVIQRRRELEVMLSNSQTITWKLINGEAFVTHSLRPEYSERTYRINIPEVAQCVEEFYRKDALKMVLTKEPGTYAMQFRGAFYTEQAHWYELRLDVRRTSAGIEKSGILVVIDNIKKEEAMLIEAHRRKVNAQERDNFINEMSHEIRTPLNAIVGFSQILTTPGMEYSEEEVEQFRELIESNNKRLLQLIENMLTIAHLRNASVALHSRSIPAHEPLQKMIEEFSEEARDKNVSLHLHDGPDGTNIKVDPMALEVVLRNLVSNAVKFTPSGGSVTLYWNETLDTVLFGVTDTGIGIAKEHIDLVFNRFFKVDPFTTGTGLGLSLVREFLLQMGGDIQLESTLGEGTRVVVTFKKQEHV